MRKKMLLEEFKKSSQRHIRTCKRLLENLHECSPKTQEHILQNVYYLAGYIFESIYKYAILKNAGHDPQTDVDTFEKDMTELKKTNHTLPEKITFKKDIKTHDFKTLKNYLELFVTGDIPFFNNTENIENDIEKLHKEWHPKFRYEVNPLVNEDRMKRLVYWGEKSREALLRGI